MRIPFPTFEDEIPPQLKNRLEEMTSAPLNPRFTTLKAFAAALEECIKVGAYSIAADQVVLLLNIMYTYENSKQDLCWVPLLNPVGPGGSTTFTEPLSRSPLMGLGQTPDVRITGDEACAAVKPSRHSCRENRHPFQRYP